MATRAEDIYHILRAHGDWMAASDIQSALFRRCGAFVTQDNLRAVLCTMGQDVERRDVMHESGNHRRVRAEYRICW
jgi:hypothetical protein